MISLSPSNITPLHIYVIPIVCYALNVHIMQEFVKAVIAYKKKLTSAISVPKSVKLDKEMEMTRKKLVRSFSIAKNLYSSGNGTVSGQESELRVGAEFLEVSDNGNSAGCFSSYLIESIRLTDDIN